MKWCAPWLLFALVPIAALAADDPCADFTWDVHAELAVLARDSVRLQAGTDAAALPPVHQSQAYRLSLAKQVTVHFETDPGKYSDALGRFAGMVRLRIAHAGRYRVSLDTAAWVDVVAAGHIVPAAAYTGSHDCARLRKVVEFQLPAGLATVQVSDSDADHVRLAVTASSYQPGEQ